jgi:choline transport protein
MVIGLASGAFMGGPPLYVYSWAWLPFAWPSAMPHSGGQYFWAAQLALPRIRRPLSYLTVIFSWGGAVFTGASISLASQP